MHLYSFQIWIFLNTVTEFLVIKKKKIKMAGLCDSTIKHLQNQSNLSISLSTSLIEIIFPKWIRCKWILVYLAPRCILNEILLVCKVADKVERWIWSNCIFSQNSSPVRWCKSSIIHDPSLWECGGAESWKKSLFDLTNSTWKCYEREKENKIWKPQMAFYTVTFLTVSAF